MSGEKKTLKRRCKNKKYTQKYKQIENESTYMQNAYLDTLAVYKDNTWAEKNPPITLKKAQKQKMHEKI